MLPKLFRAIALNTCWLLLEENECTCPVTSGRFYAASLYRGSAALQSFSENEAEFKMAVIIGHVIQFISTLCPVEWQAEEEGELSSVGGDQARNDTLVILPGSAGNYHI